MSPLKKFLFRAAAVTLVLAILGPLTALLIFRPPERPIPVRVVPQQAPATLPRFGNALVMVQGPGEQWRPVRGYVAGNRNGLWIVTFSDGSQADVPDGAVGWDSPRQPEARP